MKKSIFILSMLTLIAFKTGDHKSQYSIPQAAWSVTVGDIDNDGDNDIVAGHKKSSQTNWTGITKMYNDGYGYFSVDSFYYNGQHIDLEMQQIDSDSFPDLITQTWNNVNSQLGIIFNIDSGSSNTLSIDINDYAEYIVSGDIDNDSYSDIIFASNNGQFWGILYNDGFGNFSEPEYQYVTDYFPSAIECGDLNSDNRDDIVVCGQSTEVYFSYPDGFQPLLLETDNFKDDVSIVDFDLDGDNDILTFVGIPIIGVTSLIMYENQGNNIFDTLPEFYFQPMSSNFFITDFNNDSLKDILFQLSDKSGYIIYYNQGDFQLADSQFVALPPSNPQEGWRNCYCADMDGNGYNDIITVKTLYYNLPDNLEILFNDGNGNFGENPITTIQTHPDGYQDNNLNLTCYPNPLKYKTAIEYTIDKECMVNVSIYNMKGQKIKTLNNKILQAGKYNHTWDGTDNYGKEVDNGIYLLTFTLNEKSIDNIKLIKQ